MLQFERLGLVLVPEHHYQAKFNAGMIRVGDTVQMLYRFSEKRSRWYGRSIDWTEWVAGGEFPYLVNHIRHARLSTAGVLLEDHDQVAINPETLEEAAGCEDPRIVPFEGAYYVFYTAVNYEKVRVAVARTQDFLSFEKLGTIDNFTIDKDAFIFPERIDGQIVYMHRIIPSIQIDLVESMEELLDPRTWAGYEARVEQQTVLRGAYEFEGKKIGGGVPPIRTERGWLLVYHGVDRQGIYSVGVALLDGRDPRRVVARLPYPVLSPEADFETQGDYNGCVFPMGAFLEGETLFISYGAADRYTALARANLPALLDELARHPV
jgi:predicted GH43/DUF377 family glycosyl hydrolase